MGDWAELTDLLSLPPSAATMKSLTVTMTPLPPLLLPPPLLRVTLPSEGGRGDVRRCAGAGCSDIAGTVTADAACDRRALTPAV